MENTNILVPIFIVLLFTISHCNGDTCYCYCCVGNFCQPTLQGTIPVSSCASVSCESLCHSKYPTKCIDGPGSASYQCRSGGGSSPNWPGIFNMANRCDTRTCCCPVGKLILSSVGVNELRIQCQFIGQCPGGSVSVDDMIDMPSSYTTQIEFMGNLISVSLSQDSRTIQFINSAFPSCSEFATRDDPSSTVSMNLPSIIVLSGLLCVTRLII